MIKLLLIVLTILENKNVGESWRNSNYGCFLSAFWAKYSSAEFSLLSFIRKSHSSFEMSFLSLPCNCCHSDFLRESLVFSVLATWDAGLEQRQPVYVGFEHEVGV